MLEIYATDPPEICVGVAPHALVCAKKIWCNGICFRARKVGNSGKIPRKSMKIVPPARPRGGGGDLVWEIFQFFTLYNSRSTKPIRPKFVWEVPRML